MKRLVASACAMFLALALGACNLEVHTKAGPAELTAAVDAAAISQGVPIAFARAIVSVESNWNPNVRGQAGEYGLTQIKCGTAKGIGFTGHCDQLRDPKTNAQWGMKYARMALDKSGGDPCLAAYYYNAGLYAKGVANGYCHKVVRKMNGAS